MTIPPVVVVVCIVIAAAVLAIWLKRRAEARRHKRIMDRLMGADVASRKPGPDEPKLRHAPERFRTA